jgi:hypothetical protein
MIWFSTPAAAAEVAAPIRNECPLNLQLSYPSLPNKFLNKPMKVSLLNGRKSKITRHTCTNVDSSKKFYIFNLLSSKCDPFHKGVNIAIYENPIFKPVDTMLKYIKLRLNLGASQLYYS